MKNNYLKFIYDQKTDTLKLISTIHKESGTITGLITDEKIQQLNEEDENDIKILIPNFLHRNSVDKTITQIVNEKTLKHIQNYLKRKLIPPSTK